MITSAARIFIPAVKVQTTAPSDNLCKDQTAEPLLTRIAFDATRFPITSYRLISTGGLVNNGV